MSGYDGNTYEHDNESLDADNTKHLPSQTLAPRLDQLTAPHPLITPSLEGQDQNNHTYVSPSRRRSGARREWDTVAARIAHRTANARTNAKRPGGDTYGTERVEKKSVRRHKPGLSIDTNVAQYFQSRVQPTTRQSKQQRTQRAKKPTTSRRSVQLNANSQSPRGPSTHVAPPSNLVSRFSPETPTILITPALDSRLSGDQRRRIASSIYSRMTSGATPPVDNETVPPLPQNLAHLVQQYQPSLSQTSNLPEDHDYGSKGWNGRESTGTAFEEDLDEKQLGRITSSGTLFEEDHVPLTQESRLGHANLKLDTAVLPTPHRSRGWWDLIRTPFDNAKSLRFGRSPTDGERTPEVPAIANAVHSDQSPPYDALGLKLFPRNTHNSQALRRLESKDHLRVEPVPRLPHDYSASGNNGVSPDEREVPFVLHLSQAGSKGTAKLVDHAGPPPQLGDATASASSQGYNFSSPGSNATPESVRTEFSPVGQVVAEGEVTTARGIVSHPPQASSQPFNQVQHRLTPSDRSNSNSTRCSLTAEVMKTTPDLPSGPAARPESRWPLAAPLYFPPPPTLSSKSSKTLVRTRELEADEELTKVDNNSFTTKEKKPSWMRRLFRKRDRTVTEKSAEKKKKRRMWCYCCCLLFLVLLIIGIIIGVVLSRKHNDPGSSEQTWFNVTGYPPIPGGKLTVVRPNLITSVSGCVDPATIWSCAVPPEEQAAIKPNDPDQHDFIFNIVNGNASYNYNDTALNDFQPSPGPPALDEYAFLGNTTDGVVEPFEGEATPFYITFIETSQANSRKIKRSDTGSSSTISAGTKATSSSNVVPDIATAIPKPEVNPDGTAQAANLLTFPSYQPIRLFNRGQATEHYGFYTYYERSIFLRSVAFLNATEQQTSDVPADANGGAEESAATARCSWTDTRYKVEIWTNMANSSKILPLLNGTTAPEPGSTSLIRPGTFPYPITITLDRHGGGLTTKMLYCYGMNDQEEIIDEDKKFQPENRAFGGTIINPSVIFSSNISISTADGGPGGIDGGTGGCKCQWANWMSS